jgi:hypothetical protein
MNNVVGPFTKQDWATLHLLRDCIRYDKEEGLSSCQEKETKVYKLLIQEKMQQTYH